jgi:CheY-like chemotaxis protein
MIQPYQQYEPFIDLKKYGEQTMIKGEPINVLLVEDDPAHAEIVRRNLEDFYAAIIIVHLKNGQEALDYLFRRKTYADSKIYPYPNLILLDLRLPKVDGLEVLRLIKEDEQLKKIPKIVFSTSAAKSDMLDAYAHGAGSYLVKPADFEDFTRLMKAFGFYWLVWNQFPVCQKI